MYPHSVSFHVPGNNVRSGRVFRDWRELMPWVSRYWAKLAAMVAVFALVVPVLATGTGAQDGGKVLRVHQVGYPDVVDPQKSSFGNEIDILDLVYEGLTRLDANQATIPGAAESWEYNDDATQITFHLRPDLKYSDGSPLTAENFRYALERNCDPATAGEYQSILFGIAGCAEFAGLSADAEGNAREFTPEEHEAARTALGVKALDDSTLQIDLANPAPYFHTLASLWVTFPVKKEIVEKDPDNWWKTAENHIGNGPFTVTDIAEEQKWTFAPSDNYWQGSPKLNGIEYVYVEDAAVALEAYRAGDLDTVQLESTQMPEVLADPKLSKELVSYPLAGTYILGMGLTQEPFTDQKVREAFAYAVDRETLCAEVLAGTCSPTLSFIPTGLPGSIETDKFAFDPEAAKQALAESSYGGPENLPEIKLFYNSDFEDRAQASEWLAGEIRDILGVELVLQPTDGTTLTAMRKDPATYPQLLYGENWFQDYPDPQNWLSTFWTCDASNNHFGYCNEDFDALTKNGDTTVEEDERTSYYEQAGQLLVDDVPAVFLYNPTGNFMVNPAVTGYTPSSSEFEWPGYSASMMTIDKTE
jgi:oligopeptide transport system substrate-binding protein